MIAGNKMEQGANQGTGFPFRIVGGIKKESRLCGDAGFL